MDSKQAVDQPLGSHYDDHFNSTGGEGTGAFSSAALLPAPQDSDSGFITLPDDINHETAEGMIVPEIDNDSFSDISEESDRTSYYSSLLSSSRDYYWENGRRYHGHKGGQYMLPNDEVELDREDMKHHEWMLVTDQRIHLCPIASNPQKILDLCTGTGIWAMQAAEAYPSADVIGTDISPVQPIWVPPNLTFEIDDIEEEWLYKSNTFDLINCRFNFIAIKDWAAMLQQAKRILKPGAYIELTELNIGPEATNKSPDVGEPIQLYSWIRYLSYGMQHKGYNLFIARTFKKLLEDAGFVDIVEEVFEIPWGTWHRDKRLKAIGFWHKEQFTQGLQGIALGLLSKGLNWSPEAVEVFLVELRREIDNPNYHIMDHAYVVYGRKPLD